MGLIVANLTVLVGWLFRLKKDDGENNRAPIYGPSAAVFNAQHSVNLSTSPGDSYIAPELVLVAVDDGISSQLHGEDVEKGGDGDPIQISFPSNPDVITNRKLELDLTTDEKSDYDVESNV